MQPSKSRYQQCIPAALRPARLLRAVFGVVLLSGVARTARADVQYGRDATDDRWVRGDVTVAATPEVVWSRLRDAGTWRQIFTDIKRLSVLEHEGNRWRLELETQAFDCGAHPYDVQVQPPGTIHLVIDAPGIEAHAVLAAAEGAIAGTTRVTYALYTRAVGIVSWFVSESKLRERQDGMVRRNLVDIERVFGSVPSTQSAAARP